MAKIKTKNKQAALILEMLQTVHDGSISGHFGRLYDHKIISLAEFEKCNYCVGSLDIGLDWEAYRNYKATLLLLLLAEQGEL